MGSVLSGEAVRQIEKMCTEYERCYGSQITETNKYLSSGFTEEAEASMRRTTLMEREYLGVQKVLATIGYELIWEEDGIKLKAIEC